MNNIVLLPTKHQQIRRISEDAFESQMTPKYVSIHLHSTENGWTDDTAAILLWIWVTEVIIWNA